MRYLDSKAKETVSTVLLNTDWEVRHIFFEVFFFFSLLGKFFVLVVVSPKEKKKLH